MARLLLFGWLFSLCVVHAEEIKLAPRHVSVTGTSLGRVQPDTVVWQITIRRTDRDLAKAQAACDESVKKVLALRAEMKLKSEDIQTGYLSIQKIYDRDTAGNPTSFRHFEVVRVITVRQRDTNRFDDVLARLIATTDAEVSYQLESSEYHLLRSKTRLEAVKAARDKAAAMTELLGAKLGRVLRIAEPQETWSSYNSTSNSVIQSPRPPDVDDASSTFAPGTIEIRVSIEVVFEIE